MKVSVRWSVSYWVSAIDYVLSLAVAAFLNIKETVMQLLHASVSIVSCGCSLLPVAP